MIAFAIIIAAFLLERGITKSIGHMTEAIARLESTLANRR